MKKMEYEGYRLKLVRSGDCYGCFFADKGACPECGNGKWIIDGNAWHTGTPTEKGLYLTAIKVDDGDRKYCYAYEPVWWQDGWCFRHFKQPIIAWMPIPPFED